VRYALLSYGLVASIAQEAECNRSGSGFAERPMASVLSFIPDGYQLRKSHFEERTKSTHEFVVKKKFQAGRAKA
jgi:hypothetical protein